MGQTVWCGLHSGVMMEQNTARGQQLHGPYHLGHTDNITPFTSIVLNISKVSLNLPGGDVSSKPFITIIFRRWRVD
jgi:hypothetical protein